MKKATLAFVLTLILCIFVLASCGKTGPDATTSFSTTAHVHVRAENKTIDVPATCAAPGSQSYHCTVCGLIIPETVEAIDALPHEPAETYVIDVPATCKNDGSESKHCINCGQSVVSTARAIPKSDDAHAVDGWTTTLEPSILGDGIEQGTCATCGRTVSRSIKDTALMEWKYTTSSTTQQKKTTGVYSLLGEGEHFYADPDAGTEAVDLIIEFSFLYNPTLHNLANTPSGKKEHPVLTGSMYDADIYWIALKNDASGCSAPYAGEIDHCATLRSVEYGPEGMGGLAVPGANQYADYPNLGGADQANPEYGWHRLAFFYHQELLNADALKADGTEGATEAQYLVTSTGYLDGVKIFTISNRTSDTFRASDAFTENGVLFSARSDGEGGIVYEDVPGKKNTTWIKIPSRCTGTGTAYAVIADYYVTAGTAAVQKVARVDSPAANTYTTNDGTEINAPIYYRLVTE